MGAHFHPRPRAADLLSVRILYTVLPGSGSTLGIQFHLPITHLACEACPFLGGGAIFLLMGNTHIIKSHVSTQLSEFSQSETPM